MEALQPRRDSLAGGGLLRRLLLTSLGLLLACACRTPVADGPGITARLPDQLPEPRKARDFEGLPAAAQWLVFEADHGALQRAFEERRMLAGAACPSGTAAAYVGWAGTVEWAEEREGRITHLGADGIDLRSAGSLQVHPGPGEVVIPWWLFRGSFEGSPFERGARYVFCLSREPVATGVTVDGSPATTLDQELDHVLAIIELRPTYDSADIEDRSWLFLTRDRFRALRKRQCAYERAPAGSWGLSIEAAAGAPATLTTRSRGTEPMSEELMQLVLYMINTRVWMPPDRAQALRAESRKALADDPILGPDHPVEWGRPDYAIEWLDEQGRPRALSISSHASWWWATTDTGERHAAAGPQLWFELLERLGRPCELIL